MSQNLEFQPPQPTPALSTDPTWQQGALVEITIGDLSPTGDGVGRFEQRVVFVPDTVTGDRVRVRLLRVKPQYAQGKLQEILTPSPQRIRPSCIVADKCGGCQWQHVSYEAQLAAKRDQIVQALQRIGGFDLPEDSLASIVDPIFSDSPSQGYRNKVTYPLARSRTGQVQAGYYQKGSHQLVNLNQCPIQDARLNPLLADIKQDLYDRGWGIYDETQHRGKLRHLGLRIGRRTGQMLLTLVSRDLNLTGLEEQAQSWLNRYPDLKGVCVNVNPDRTNAIFGSQTHCIAGQAYLEETFAGLTFEIGPETFFQVHTEQAERLLTAIMQHLDLQGTETVVDAYSGIGTLTLPIAQRVQQVIGLEIQPAAITQAERNAQINQIDNVTFIPGAVGQQLQNLTVQPDIVLLDPPRKGCEPIVIDTLRELHPERIVYVSCNPATLARDLKRLCAEEKYRLQRVQPADFFPQTAHVECAAFLIKV